MITPHPFTNPPQAPTYNTTVIKVGDKCVMRVTQQNLVTQLFSFDRDTSPLIDICKAGQYLLKHKYGHYR